VRRSVLAALALLAGIGPVLAQQSAPPDLQPRLTSRPVAGPPTDPSSEKPRLKEPPPPPAVPDANSGLSSGAAMSSPAPALR
jgi:hypothetical protein